MPEQNKTSVDDAPWLKQLKELFRGFERDTGYMEPGDLKYKISKNMPGYAEQVHVSVEWPLRRSEDIDKESLVLSSTSPTLLQSSASRCLRAAVAGVIKGKHRFVCRY